MMVVSRFSDAIEAARGNAATRRPSLDTSSLNGGPEVQLSVRVPEGLRSAVASTAGFQALTVTAFVARALERAVIEFNDSFAGLAADLASNVRAEIRSTVEDNTYRSAATEVDREEAWS